MPKVYLSEADRMDAIFQRAYGAATTAPKIPVYEVSRRTGIPIRTLYNRIKDPGFLRVSELRDLARVLDLDRDTIADFILGRR